MATYSFEIKFDEFASSHRRYILCVRKGKTSVEAPRYATFHDALEAAGNYAIYNNVKGTFNIKVNLPK